MTITKAGTLQSRPLLKNTVRINIKKELARLPRFAFSTKALETLESLDYETKTKFLQALKDLYRTEIIRLLNPHYLSAIHTFSQEINGKRVLAVFVKKDEKANSLQVVHAGEKTTVHFDKLHHFPRITIEPQHATISAKDSPKDLPPQTMSKAELVCLSLTAYEDDTSTA